MWREEAVKEQQKFFDLFGKPVWREFEPSQYCNLKREIGFALFGVPEEEPHANLNDGTGYTDKKLKEINKIFEKCMQNCNNGKSICVSFFSCLGRQEMLASQFLSYECLSLVSFLMIISSSIHVVEYTRVGKIIWKIIRYQNVNFAIQEMVCTQQ